MSDDLRDVIFQSIAGRIFVAEIRVTTSGTVSGVEMACRKAEEAGCAVLRHIEDAAFADAHEPVLVISGPPKAIAIAEDCVPGAIAKPSGIARAARRAQELAGDKVRVVSGAAKKFPLEIKDQVRRAIHKGGGSGRIAPPPFVYLDKNYVRMFGGVRRTLEGISGMEGYTRAIQLRGLVQDIAEETRIALEFGAEILMVDTGRLEDLETVAAIVRAAGRRAQTTIAFSGDIGLDHIPQIASGYDVDVLDIGRAVIDAPMVDVKFDVVDEARSDTPTSNSSSV
ncbi:MAG: hypothetical protein WBA88_15465 [Pseudaminobacter sp.]